jgi:hypothetical protein
MLQDREYTLTIRNREGNTATHKLTITAKQQQDTLSRRITTLMPGNQVIDITDNTSDHHTAAPLEAKRK